MKDKQTIKALIALHVMLMFYSMSGVCSKIAAHEKFMNYKFCLCYAIIIGLLAVYAVVWQQIIKKTPLTTAYANKAITIVWGIVWGKIFYQEAISFGKIIGAILVIVGVVFYTTECEAFDE